MAQMTALRRRMIDDMTVRNLSPATQQSYVYAVAKFSRFFGCSPDRLGIEEVRAYQLHLAGLGWSWSHINQVSCALRFFFGVTLGRPEAFDRIISAKEPKKLPVVLSGEEIVRFLQAVPGLRNRAALTTAYGAGLRVCEVAALKVGDIDSSRMVIRVAGPTSPAQSLLRLHSVFPASTSPPKLNPVEPPWYGPVCPVVWEGWHREVSPYPNQWWATSSRICGATSPGIPRGNL